MSLFAFKMSLLRERHLMTVVINLTSYSRHMSVINMSVLYTPLQVKCTIVGYIPIRLTLL